jgi:hypothetical protein
VLRALAVLVRVGNPNHEPQKGDEWYHAPPGVISSAVGGRQLYFLPGTSASTPVPGLPDPGRTWRARPQL